jgi:hypothetical protein
MTLLTLAQDILKETKNPSLPLTIIGNTQNSAVQALTALTNSIKSLARDYDWQELYRVEDFTGVVDQEGYDLPSDFDRFVNDTFWNVSKRRPCEGPMSASDWRLLKDSITGAGAFYDYYRIVRNQFEIYPTPTATDDYVYEYITNLIVESSGGTGQTTWLADTDVPVIDEYMLKLDATWRLLKNQGMPYAQEQQIALKAILQRTSVSGGKKTIRHSPRYGYGRVGFPYIVQNV